MVAVKSVSIGKGVSWIGAGWQNFRQHPTMWFFLTTLFLALFIVLGSLSLGGTFVAWLMSPVFMGGLLYAARESELGRPLTLGHLVYGFGDSKALWKLVGIGGLMLIMVFLNLLI